MYFKGCNGKACPTQVVNSSQRSDWLSKALICVVFAALVGSIALLGVSGSTLINLIINIVQITSLPFLGLLMVLYRIGHPNVNYEHANALSVVVPHDLVGLIYQVTIAILLLVGFESATAMAGEAVNPRRDIPEASSCRCSSRFASATFLSTLPPTF